MTIHFGSLWRMKKMLNVWQSQGVSNPLEHAHFIKAHRNSLLSSFVSYLTSLFASSDGLVMGDLLLVCCSIVKDNPRLSSKQSSSAPSTLLEWFTGKKALRSGVVRRSLTRPSSHAARINWAHGQRLTPSNMLGVLWRDGRVGAEKKNI